MDNCLLKVWGHFYKRHNYKTLIDASDLKALFVRGVVDPAILRDNTMNDKLITSPIMINKIAPSVHYN